MGKVWYCKIGECEPEDLLHNSDQPMRDAVAKEYQARTGKEPDFIFSRWGAELTEPERAVVEDRPPKGG